MMKLTKIFLLLFGLVLLVCGGVYLFRDQVLVPVLQRVLVRTIRAELGMEVTVATISGTYFRDLRLTGVRTVKASETGVLVALDAGTLQATYSLPLLLAGFDTFLGSLSLELDGARVQMDFTRDDKAPGGEGAAPRSAFVLPVTRARDSRLDIRGRDWALALSGMDVVLGPFDEEQGGFPLAVHGAQSVIELPAMRRQTPELAARGMLFRDSVRVDGLEVNGKPAVEAARFDYGPAAPFSCAVSFAAFGGSGKIHGVFADTATELGWDLRGVDLAAVAPLFTLAAADFAGHLTSSGSLDGNFSDPVSLVGTVSLDVTDGRVRNNAFKHVALAGTAADGILRIDSFLAEMGRNLVSASGVSAPLAVLVAGDAEKMVESTRGYFNASLEDIPALLHLAGVEVAGEYLQGRIPAHRLVVGGRAGDDGLTLESGTFSGGSATVTMERCAVTLPRTGPLLTGLGLSVKLAANIPDLGEIAAIFGVDTSGGSLAAKVTLEGTLPNLKGSVELHGRDIRYRAGAADTILLVARSGPAGWRIDNLEAVHGEDRLTGRGVITMDPVMFRDLVLDLTVRDFHPYLSWFMAGDPPAARGSLDGHLELAGSWADPAASFRAVLAEATIAGVSVSRGELTGLLAGERLEVTTLMAQMPEGRVELAGACQHRAWGLPVTATINRLTLGRDDMLLQLQAPVAVRVSSKTSWFFEEATLQGDGGAYRLGGGVSPQGGYDISLGLSAVRSESWRAFFPELPVEFQGLNLEGTVTGPLAAPEVELSGSVAELRAPNAFVPLAGQFAVRLSSRGVDVKKFSWTTAAGEESRLDGAVPYDPFTGRFIPGKLDLEGGFSIPDLGVFTVFLPEDLRMPGSVTGTLRISGTVAHPEASLDFHATDIRLPAAVPVRPPGPVTVDAVATFKDNDLHIATLTAYSKDLSIAVAGAWRDAGDLLKHQPATGLPGTLDFRGNVAVNDLGWLGRGGSTIRRLGGKLDGTMAVSGPAAKPEVTAELSLAAGEFRAEGTMPPLRNLRGHLSLAQRTATIDRFTGSVGGSPFAVEGSVALPETGAPEADLRVHGANVLLYRNEGVWVRGDADITVRGVLAAPAFSGNIAITDGRLQKNVNWLEPLRDIARRKALVSGAAKTGGSGLSFHNPPLKDATFDIHVVSTNPFRIKSNVARGALRPDLWLRGTGEVPLLTGVIYVDPSRVMLPGGRVTVESGLIRFPEKSPGRAVLEIAGSSRILGYDINITVSGPYDEPVVTLSSVPPLPQDALLLLLLTGKLPPGVMEPNSGWQGGMAVALYVSKGVLGEWFGKNDLDSEESMLDRFDVILGRGISRQGNETIGAQYRLADGVVRAGDELYLVTERDIYDEFNAGVRIVFQFK